MEDFVDRFSSTRKSHVDGEDPSDRVRTAASPGGYPCGVVGSDAPAVKRHRIHSDPEHKKRRAIANSNERKRMQSINAGFNSLRNLVCPKTGDKLSKAAILKYTADFIKNLLAEKRQLLADNQYLEQQLGCSDLEVERRSRDLLSQHPLPRPGKRRCREAESLSSDEGIGFTAAEEILITSSSGNITSDQSITELQRQIKELEEQVEKEKAMRRLAEADKKLQESLQLQDTLSSSRELTPNPLSDSATSGQEQTSAVLQLPDLHIHTWRRGLETIVEAIRHIEGEQGMFGSEGILHPQQNTGLCSTTRSQLKADDSFESSSILSQLHPVRISDISGSALSPVSLPNQMCFTPLCHRPSLAAPSS